MDGSTEAMSQEGGGQNEIGQPVEPITVAVLGLLGPRVAQPWYNPSEQFQADFSAIKDAITGRTVGQARPSRAAANDAPQEAAEQVAQQPQEPAVPIRKSVFPEYIVCLEDGKKLKMLKRYLASRFGMSPDEYRAKWGLPSNYPMVAPAYSERRSNFAKKIGLGATGRGRKAAAEQQADTRPLAHEPARQVPKKGTPGRKPRRQPEDAEAA